jgi:hypothetical protein
MNTQRPQHSLTRYFDYKRYDKTAKCRICNQEVERTAGNNINLTNHLKGQGLHEEFFKMYKSAKRKFYFNQQQKKRPHDDDDKVGNEDNEEVDGEKEQNASGSQPTMLGNAIVVNLRKKPRKN